MFNPELFSFLRWMSYYYYAGIGDVLNASLPPGMRKMGRPSYLPADSFELTARDASVPEKTIAKVKARGVMTGREASSLERKSPGIMSALETAGAIIPTYADTGAVPSGILLGYRPVEAQSTGDEWLIRIIEAASETGVLQKREILALGISEYRFNKLVKQGALNPVYGLP
ncbi:MAG: hypothetical protein JSU69_05660, partial [Candidatus Zixiibacteriota bacterium]